MQYQEPETADLPGEVHDLDAEPIHLPVSELLAALERLWALEGDEAKP